MTIQPLNDRIPIINSDGTPTQYFLRQLQDRGITTDSKITAEQALEIIEGWSADRDVNVTAPIIGGGSLDNDITIGMAASGVTPGSYTNTDLTVDAFGRITAASNGSGGGGGGSYFSGATGSLAASSGSSFASKGFLFSPDVNMMLTAVTGWIDPNSTSDVYAGFIVPVNPTTGATTAAGTLTPTQTTNVNTEMFPYRFVFTTPVALTAGSWYTVGVVITSGTGTTVCRVGSGPPGANAGWRFNAPVTMPKTATPLAGYASNSLSTFPLSSGVSTSAGYYFNVSIEGTY